MTSQRNLSTGFTVRFLAGVLMLCGLIVAGLSLASDAETKPPAMKKPVTAARPPEEEEPNPPPVNNHKVKVGDGNEAAPAAVPGLRAIDLKQAARDAKKTPIKDLFLELAVPHDVMTCVYPHRTVQNIVPIPDYIGKNTDVITEPFSVTPYPRNSWIPADPVEVKKSYIESIKPYEEVALRDVDAFLKEPYEKSHDPKERMTRYEQDVAAEQVLTTVFVKLQSKRKTGERRGGDWETVEDNLKKKLFSVLLDELDILVKKGDWEPSFALTKRLAATFNTPEEQNQIAKPLAEQIHSALTHAPDNKQRIEARRRLRLMEQLFPDSEALDASAEVLRQEARAKIAEANREWEANGKKDSERIAKLVNEAESEVPNEPAIRKFQLKKNQERPTLRVGVRELPSQMSPALARSDSDQCAVELMFESLVKLHSDGEGGCRWEPGLAKGPPRMIVRGRQFQLAADGRWSNGERITAGDVRETVSQIKAGKIVSRPPVWGNLLDSVVVGEAVRVNLTLPQGWLDPLALMNFKVLPAGSAPDSNAFAAHPIGSGPFLYAENIKTDNGRPCVAFTANPYYGARPGKAGLPRIDEIHFILYKDASAALDVRQGAPCDLMLDLTAKEAAALREKAAALDIYQPPIASTNRRIYFLAVNHRNSTLANAAFRLRAGLRRQPRQAVGQFSGVSRAATAHAAERPLSRQIVGVQPRLGPEQREPIHSRSVQSPEGQSQQSAGW